MIVVRRLGYIVVKIGILVFGFILVKNLNSKLFEVIVYMIFGKGNWEFKRFDERL